MIIDLLKNVENVYFYYISEAFLCIFNRIESMGKILGMGEIIIRYYKIGLIPA